MAKKKHFHCDSGSKEIKFMILNFKTMIQIRTIYILNCYKGIDHLESKGKYIKL